jgi:hypothetical protein
MPRPYPRRDGYGRPLPTLADAHEAVLVDRPFNQAVRRLLFQLLDDRLVALCRRGTYARVQLSFEIRDGMLDANIDVQVAQIHRYTPEET